METEKLTRKCAHCGEPIIIDESAKNNALHYKKKWYHLSCFKKSLEAKMKKGKSKDAPKVYDSIPQLIADTNDFIDDVVVKDAIYRHMLNCYDVSLIPNDIFTRLDSIYNGTMKGLAQPIPPAHLLDMWVQKQKWLDKVGKAKNIEDGVQRIRYDLAVLCCKYKDYLKWLEREKLIAEYKAIEEKENKKNNIDLNKIKTNAQDDGLGDINDLIDELI